MQIAITTAEATAPTAPTEIAAAPIPRSRPAIPKQSPATASKNGKALAPTATIQAIGMMSPDPEMPNAMLR